MEMDIVNKVASSGIVTIDLEEFHDKGERVVFDLVHNLYQGLILKEKDFREFLKEHDWTQYREKNVSVVCTADAIIPTWAYMLVVSKLQGLVNHVVVGDLRALEQSLFQRRLNEMDLEQYRNSKVVIKGCGDISIGAFVYGEITRLLLPFVSSLMYGEPCSTVPVYKSKKV